MKIAIVGEGPIGVIVCLYFIYYKMKYQLTDLELYFYKSRNKFERRHIVKVKSVSLKHIESLIESCDNCIRNGNDNDIIELSIRCLETILHKHINSTYVTMIEQSFTTTENDGDKFDHIFLCDGFASKNRKHYVYDDKERTPLKMVITQPIIVLYKNINEIGSLIDTDCIHNLEHKKQYTYTDLLPYSIQIDEIVPFISLVYNIMVRYNDFIAEIPNDEDQLKQTNLWIEGFINYDNFIEIFTSAIRYIGKLNKETIIRIFKNYNTNISDHMLRLLDHREMIQEQFDLYKVFVSDILDNSSSKPFMVHNVMPNCSSFGIVLDDSDTSLLFCKKTNNTTTWLIGDSANSYPPGYGLQNGINSVFAMIPYFVHFYLLPDIVIPFYENDVINCEDSTYIYDQRKICDKLSEYKFSGGYSKENTLNEEQISIHELLEKIKSKSCMTDDDFMNRYNNYQLNIFFKNLIDYVCTTVGGKHKKKYKSKKRNKYHKNHKSKKKK